MAVIRTAVENNGVEEAPDAPVQRPAIRDSFAAAESVAGHVRAMLELLGEDPSREGLLKTPMRVAKAYQFLLQGYDAEPRAILESAIYEGDFNEMVLVKSIETYSLCEHHLLPFVGKTHVAYIPCGRVVGLSKIPRVVEAYARRLQIQERLTIQIRDAIQDVLEPHGVAVVMEASHLCMAMRGVQKQHSLTTTSAMSGELLSNPKSRAECLRLMRDN